MDLAITQVEVAVLQTHLLTRQGRSVDLKGKSELTRTEYLDLCRLDLDLARSELCVVGILVALHYLALNEDDGLFRNAREHCIVGKDDLGDTVVVAQVNEEHAAVVADRFDPTRERYRLTDVRYG